MNTILQDYRKKVYAFEKKLNGDYRPNSSDSLITFAKLTLLLPILGIFYLWVYFDSFGVSYFDSFNLTDSIAILYQKTMWLILIVLAFSTILLSFAYPVLFMKKENKGTLNVLFVLILVTFGILSLWMLCDINKFPLHLTLIILLLVGIGFLAYLFLNRTFGSLILITSLFWYFFANAQMDAKSVKDVMPKYSITLKEHSDTPILNNNDEDKFLIFKTTGYYFIKNIKENLIYRYSITTGEFTIFTPYG